jgi:hypothetical protein
MMLNHYRNYNQSYTFDSMINGFFSNLPAYLKSPSYDPVTVDRVDLYLDNSSLGNKRADFIKRAEMAAVNAKEAYEHGEQYPSVAISKWKDFFGDFFPAYG